MHNYISIRRQCEWERKKRAFWKYVFIVINIFLSVTGGIYWLNYLADRFGVR